MKVLYNSGGGNRKITYPDKSYEILCYTNPGYIRPTLQPGFDQRGFHKDQARQSDDAEDYILILTVLAPTG